MNFIIKSNVKVLIEKQISQIKEKFEVSGSVETIKFNFRDNSLADILEDASTFPMWSDYKLFVLHNPDFLTAKGSSDDFENDYDQLMEFIRSKCDFSILVFITEDFDKRKKIVKDLLKESSLLDLSNLENDKIEQVVVSKLTNHNKQITPELAKYVCDRLSYNLSLIYIETDKLLLTNEEIITKETIDLLVSRTLEDNIFELTASIVSKDAKKSYAVYKDLIMNKEDPIKLIAIIASQIRLMIQVKGYAESGFNSKEIASKLSVHPYRCSLALEASKTFESTVLSRYLNMLCDTDFMIKSGKIDKFLGLELFLLTLNS